MVCFSMSSVSIQCSVRKQYFIRVRRHCTNLLWIWSHRWVINSIYRHLLYHIVRYRWTFWTACGRSATTWIGLDALWTDCVSHDIQYVSSAQLSNRLHWCRCASRRLGKDAFLNNASLVVQVTYTYCIVCSLHRSKASPIESGLRKSEWS